MTEKSPTVLFVDDEPAIADGHAARLADQYTTLTAYSGRAALETMTDEVDVVCLDRRMPDMAGREVLDAIRAEGYDCRVVMLTGVEPDADIVEMGFDEYLVKPIDKDDLLGVVDRLATEADETIDAAILDALGDPKTRRCCLALAESSLSAQELAETTGYSLTTVYRRLNALQQAGMIESQMTIDADGNHYETFTAIPARIQIEITDRMQVDVDVGQTDEQRAD